MVYMHWGVEGQTCPSPSQRNLARALAAAGADVVVGSHAHLQQGAGWLGDTYVDYGLGNFLWYHNGSPETGVLRVRIVDGHVVSDRWVPARIPLIGPPVPVHGRARTEAVARWRGLRACAGLASRPASSTTRRSVGVLSSVRRIGPALRDRMRSTHGPACPVPWSDLRSLHLSYVGFDGEAHTGEIIVAAEHARDMVGVFAGCTTPAGRSGACGPRATTEGTTTVDGGRQHLWVQLPSGRGERRLGSGTGGAAQASSRWSRSARVDPE